MAGAHIKRSELVSVVLPTNGRVGYCLEAVKSILCQTHSNLELIIIDNGNGRDLLLSQLPQDPRIHYYSIDNDGLVAKSRNLGITVSQGDFVAFCDDDDLWHPLKLQLQLQILLRGEFNLCCTKMHKFTDGEIFDMEEIEAESSTGRALSTFELLIRNKIFTSSVIISKPLIEAGFRFVESEVVSPFEDYLAWMEHKVLGLDYFILSLPLTMYRVSESQESARIDSSQTKIIQVYCEFLRRSDLRGYFRFLVYLNVAVRSIWDRIKGVQRWFSTQ